jgi:hypothetical protein
MKYSPMRRAQLVAPFGVGAMFTAPDGTSMITGGLDGWFDPSATTDLQTEEFRISEWRLEHSLHVAELRLPPDHRRRRRGQEAQPNLDLEVPALRFPLWHFCPSPSCRALLELRPHHSKRTRCPVCERRLNAGDAAKPSRRKAPFLAQVPFIAMCELGHLEDFPWREWVHRSTNPSCPRQMYLRATGGATLAAQTVHCDCGVAPRNLSQITEAYKREGQEDTVLTSALASDDRYTCRGRRPWVDDRIGEGCGLPLRGSLRSSTAAYFAHVVSAIYLPGGSSGLPDGLAEALDKAPLKYKLDAVRQLGPVTTAMVRRMDDQSQVGRFTDEEVTRALEALESGKARASDPRVQPSVDADQLRRPEYEMLRHAMTSEDLIVRQQQVPLFDEDLGRYFAEINLVEQLRETRVMYGFSRIEPNPVRPIAQLKRQLWAEEPSFGASWLPAYVVNGEGIFLGLAEGALRRWETLPQVAKRVALLAAHPERARALPALEDPATVPRFVLLHTLAHLLINQLVFECGYSSASLRERIFCAGGSSPMAGILIYTAAGDSEGTMGGLVRMGTPGRLEPALVAALDRAQWCSSDPVCMELGEKGQGPRSTNLAACHACGLLPETACEVFNTFLDRALVTGTHDDTSVGFFAAF